MITPISANYGTKVVELARAEEGLLRLTLLDNAVMRAGTATATSQKDSTTPPSSVVPGRIRPCRYSSIGLDAALADPQNGWQSLAVSDGTGVINQQLTITYSQAVTAQNFWWVADEIYHPVNFLVEIRVGGVWQTLQNVTNHDLSYWAYRNSTQVTFDAIRITVTKVVPVGGNVQIFTFGPVHQLIVDGAGLTDFAITEDLYEDSGDVLGQVTANILDATLDNADKWFTATFTGSPFYQMLTPGLKLESFVGLEVADDSYEFVKFGTFFTSEWSTPSTNTEATLVAYDRLRQVMEQPTPMIPAFGNTTIQFLIRELFNTLGLVENTDYTVDSSINVPIKAGWCPGPKVGDALQLFTIAGNIAINVNRQNVIQVLPYTKTGVSAATITDDDLVVWADNPQLFRDVCTEVRLDVYKHTLSDTQSVAKVEQQVIEAGATVEFQAIVFSQPPIAEITNVRVTGSQYAIITNIDYGALECNVSVQNTAAGGPITVDLEIFGRTITLTPSKKVAGNGNTWGEKIVEVSNSLIQDDTFAATYATSLATFLGDNHRKFTCEWRVNPIIELGDIIDITDNTDGIYANDVVLSQLKVVYSGGLDGELTAHKKMT